MMNLSKNKSMKIQFSHYLPHNFLAEKIILSSMLFNNITINTINKNLSVETFYFKNHQEIFKVIVYIYEKTNHVDVIILVNFLQQNGLLKKVGGIKVLLDLANQIPNLIHLEEYIKLIKDKFIRRKLIKLGYRIINSSYITNIPLNKIIVQFEQQLFDLNKVSNPYKLLNNTELIYQIFLDLKEKKQNQTLPGLISGFYKLDSLTQGFQNSDLIIIAGRPSIGKTAFSLTLSLNIIKLCKVPILFFSLEMTREHLM